MVDGDDVDPWFFCGTPSEGWAGRRRVPHAGIERRVDQQLPGQSMIGAVVDDAHEPVGPRARDDPARHWERLDRVGLLHRQRLLDRKSTRLNSSHVAISYAVFCLK